MIRPKSFDVRFASYLHPDAVMEKNGVIEGRMQFEGRRAIRPGVEAFAAVDVWGDNSSLSSGRVYQLAGRSSLRPNVNLSELYANFQFDRCDLRLGIQKISWGKADGHNPTDVFGIFDYADLLNPTRLGSPGVHAVLYSEKNQDESFEIFVRPLYSPSRSGRIASRWRPILGNGVTAVPGDIRFPSNTPDHAGYGLKWSGRAGHADVSMMMAQTVDDVAAAELIAGAVVRPLFLKKRTAGFDASFTVNEGQTELHAEAAYTSCPSGFDDDYAQWVIGGRRTFVDIHRSIDAEAILEWAGEKTLSVRSAPLVRFPNIIQRQFPGSILGRLNLDLTEFVYWSLKGALTYRGSEAYALSSDLSWRVSDLLELRLGFDALSGGGAETPASVYEENDRWRLESTIYFR